MVLPGQPKAVCNYHELRDDWLKLFLRAVASCASSVRRYKSLAHTHQLTGILAALRLYCLLHILHQPRCLAESPLWLRGNNKFNNFS
jgi:hypothetical protein